MFESVCIAFVFVYIFSQILIKEKFNLVFLENILLSKLQTNKQKLYNLISGHNLILSYNDVNEFYKLHQSN